MSKRHITRYILCGLVSGLLLVNSANAQVPFGVTFDVSGDVADVITEVSKDLVTKLKQYYTDIRKGITLVKGAIGKVERMNKTFLAKVPGSKEVKVVSVDIYDPKAVETAFNELFLQYPSRDAVVNNDYEQKGVQLYYDTMVEIQTALNSLESRFDEQRRRIEAFKIEELPADQIPQSTGEDDDKAAEEAAERMQYYNAYRAQFEFNKLLRITEELVAMRNQYEAVRMLRQPRTVLPKDAPAEDDVQQNSFIFGHEKMAFAQMTGAAISDNPSVPEDSAVDQSASAFAIPKGPEETSPFKDSVSQLEALKEVAEVQKVADEAMDIHNLLQKMPDYKDMYIQYNNFLKLRERACEAVRQADMCTLNYLSRYYGDKSKTVWYGHQDEPTDGCDFAAREGLSGWAVTAFDTANAAVGKGIDVTDFATQNYDFSDQDGTIKEPDTSDRGADKREASNAYAQPGNEQDYVNSVREVELLAWQVGSKAALLLAEDQYSANPKYGVPEHPYPIWNDQRGYYDQYISGKYDNIKAYIKNMDVLGSSVGTAELLNNGTEDEEEYATNSEDLNELKEYISTFTQTTDISRLLDEKTAALTSVLEAQEAALSSQEYTLAQMNEQLNDISEKINEVTSEINDQEEAARLNESKGERAGKDVQFLTERNTDADSSLYKDAKQAIEDSAKAYDENIAKLEELQKEKAKYVDERDGFYDRIDALKKQIETTKQKYQEELVAIEHDYDSRILALQSAPSSAPTLSGLGGVTIHNESLSAILSTVDGLVGAARNCAMTMIDNHLADIEGMAKNDALYLNSKNKEVVEKHVALINRLKNLPESCFITQAKQAVYGMENISYESIIELISKVFNDKLDEICGSVNCAIADNQYFVGLPAKERDFTAPHAPLTAHYPSPRDIVHLDLTDYKNIPMTEEGKISHSAFLEYGPEQPYIWQLLLSDKAFIERGVNLAEVLEKGGEGKTFMRGHMLPCHLKGSIIDINEKTQYQAATVGTMAIPGINECQGLKLKGLGILEDTEVDDKKRNKTVIAGNDVSSPGAASELGMFLSYTNNNLKINDLPFGGFNTLIEKQEDAEKTGKNKLNVEDNAFARAMFDVNQIGEFLSFVDKTKQIEKSMDKIEISMEEMKENLREAFEKIGRALKDDLDLSKSADYEEVTDTLKEVKNTLLGKVSSGLDAISSEDSTVKERYDKVENTYLCLVHDPDAVVKISAHTKDGDMNTLIKTAKTDLKVVEKTRKEGYDAIQKEIDEYKQPRCLSN